MGENTKGALLEHSAEHVVAQGKTASVQEFCGWSSWQAGKWEGLVASLNHKADANRKQRNDAADLTK